MRVHMCTDMWAHLCVHMCMHMCTCVCMADRHVDTHMFRNLACSVPDSLLQLQVSCIEPARPMNIPDLTTLNACRNLGPK